MSFEIIPHRTFDWPVTISVPDGADAEGNPRRTPCKVTVTFKELTSDELTAAVRESDNDGQFLEKVVTGWQDVTTGGKEFPYSVTNLKTLVSIPYAVNAITSAYLDAMRGAAERTWGNSKGWGAQ